MADETHDVWGFVQNSHGTWVGEETEQLQPALGTGWPRSW